MSDHSPDNRLNVDYRKAPRRKVDVAGGIVDIHNHAGNPEHTQNMVDAARAYGVTEFVTMAPLEHAAGLKEKYPGVFRFVAVPGWKPNMPKPDDAFFADWKKRLEIFRTEHGSKFFKFHAAPGTMRRWGITLDDPRIREVAQHAYDLGYNFMSHVGDPKAWFLGSGSYADGTWGTHASQFAQLERLLEKYPDRIHMGAHMGGSLESLADLTKRMDRYPHYVLDSSATRWIVRAVSEQPVEPLREFFEKYQDRILFGTDNVVGFGEPRSFDHYASRYYAHQLMWETDYDGESPIDDPDGGKGFDSAANRLDPRKETGVPRLKGLNLSPQILQKIYRSNSEKWFA